MTQNTISRLFSALAFAILLGIPLGIVLAITFDGSWLLLSVACLILLMAGGV